MYRGQTVGVVVPAYNEEGFVGDVLDALPSLVDRVYVVDDASTDGTWDEIRRHARAAVDTAPVDASPSAVPVRGDGGRAVAAAERFDAGRVLAVRHAANRGAGGAIKTGYLHARAEGVDVTVTMDADGQMDPDLLPRLLDPIVEGRADYAKGNRLATRADRREMPRFRRVGNWLLTFLTRVASGYWGLLDPQNGYTAVSRRALAAVRVEDLYDYYGYCNDLLGRLNAARMRVADVPMPAKYGDEQSSIRYRTYIPKVSGLLLRTFLRRLNTRYLAADHRRVPGCYAVGAFAAAFAAGLAFAAVAGVALTGAADGPAAAATLSAAVGAAFLVAGAALDRRANRHLEVAA